MTHFRTRHMKCVIMTQCVVTTRQKCVMRHENELRHRKYFLPILNKGVLWWQYGIAISVQV